jgi:hypothetical protein
MLRRLRPAVFSFSYNYKKGQKQKTVRSSLMPVRMLFFAKNPESKPQKKHLNGFFL